MAPEGELEHKEMPGGGTTVRVSRKLPDRMLSRGEGGHVWNATTPRA